jgi:hypothetical protein
MVQFPRESLGVFSYSTAMEEFSEFIFMQSLLYLPLEGGQVTWSNNQEDQTWFRIDRFLISSKWEELFPEVTQRRLRRLLLDHFPLLLDCGAPRGGSKYFKFENLWLT